VNNGTQCLDAGTCMPTQTSCTSGCGYIDDGCGNPLGCPGYCAPPQTCGGAGIRNQCGGPTCVNGTCGMADPVTTHEPYYGLPSQPQNVDPLDNGAGSTTSTFNVALKFPPGGDGICGPSGCFIPLDANSPTGYQVNGDRVQLPKKVCELLNAPQANGSARPTVVFSSSGCTSKTESIPTCGPWSGVLPSGANLKVQCANSFVQPCFDCAAQYCETEAKACFGDDWVHGNWGGSCPAEIKCFCSLTDQQLTSIDGGNPDQICGLKNDPNSPCNQSGCFGNNGNGQNTNPFNLCFQAHCNGLCGNNNNNGSDGGPSGSGCGGNGGTLNLTFSNEQGVNPPIGTGIVNAGTSQNQMQGHYYESCSMPSFQIGYCGGFTAGQSIPVVNPSGPGCPSSSNAAIVFISMPAPNGGSGPGPVWQAMPGVGNISVTGTNPITLQIQGLQMMPSNNGQNAQGTFTVSGTGTW
jgi:hypothetical protein